MKDFYFSDDNEVHEYLNYGLSEVKKEELVVFEFSDAIDPKLIDKTIVATSALSLRFYMKLDGYAADLDQKISLFLKLGAKNFCLKLKLAEVPNHNIDVHVKRWRAPEDYCQLVRDFKQLSKRFKHLCGLSIEILLDEKYLDNLHPTVSHLNEIGLNWIFLNPLKMSFNNNTDRLREIFNLLRINHRIHTNLYFTPSHPEAEHWNNRTDNLFSGPRYVDIDIANTCTHNCVFCGLYSDESLARYKANSGDKLSQNLIEKMKAKIDRDTCLNFIYSLPDNVEFIQFGGLGDPFTHKNVFEFIEACRLRSANVSCLTNFSYMTEELLDKLHSLSSASPEALTFIVNLSAANAKTYALNRPNQSQKTFDKVISHLKYSQDLRLRDGYGITFSLMSVTNKLNYKDMPELVALAKDTGAEKLWIKPIEVHGDETMKYLIPPEEQGEYARHAKLLMLFAKKLNVFVFMPEVLELIITENAAYIAEYESRISIEKQFEVLCESSELIRNYYTNKVESKYNFQLKPRPREFYHNQSLQTNDVRPKLVPRHKPAENAEVLTLGVANADLQGDFYDNLSCKIGNNYVRVEVLGNALPCCISNISLNNIKGKSLKDVWFSDSLSAFRDKMNKIAVEKFHKTDPNWTFCQQCPHLGINVNFHEKAGQVLEPLN